MIDEERRDFYLYYIYRRYDENDIEEVCYVGRGCGDRIDDHLRDLKKGKHYNYLLQSWFDDNDSTFFSCLIFTDLTNEEANALEIKHIAEYGRFDLGLGTLANLTDGGDGIAGLVFTAEHRAKLSAARKGKPGKPLTKEHRAKISAAGKGRTHTKEARAKMSEAQKGKPGTNKGKKFTSEHCSKISSSLKNKPLTEEHRAKLALAKLGKPRTQETRNKISKATKGVKHPMYGKTHSAEARAKISEARKKQVSPMKGKKMTPEQIAANSQAQKAAWARRKAAQEQHTLKQAAD